MNDQKSILKEADEAVNGDRRRDYGDPGEGFKRVAAIWNIQLGAKLKEPITAREVALMQVSLKLVRDINTPKRDNLVDIAGYAECAGMCAEREPVKSSGDFTGINVCCHCGKDITTYPGSWTHIGIHFLCFGCSAFIQDFIHHSLGLGKPGTTCWPYCGAKGKS